ncbi:hypothetical protein LRS74_04060 [Streptomyces sp. LX-29]|uniref:hypothetical protein n=1 Tax=Streptomyces sp. LX-29 TaxID=2900152 RepID=UPI00240E7AAB|nr:hypothetical protein [Streptomyces sp. LX-29]WFB06311.1 hypothetical protein LRS74_04060 [Streptomyces sp. LX-29]
MAHTRNGGEHHHGPQPPGRSRRPGTSRRALRREVPSTVGLLTDAEDFAAMRRYATFGFTDHAVYLRQMDGLLRELAARQVHITVALFDPVEYEEFCEDAGLDPDHPDSRTRYVAELAAAGPTVPYAGQPVELLVSRLIEAAEQQATAEYATALLSRLGDCADCGADAADAAFRRASAALRELLAAAGPGVHHYVCSVPAAGGPLNAVLHVEHPADASPRLVEAEAAVFSTVLSVAIATDSPGGIVLRSTVPGEPDRVRGWVLHAGWLRPLSEGEVFTAYCTDADTGEPIPPEHGVEYAAGFLLPRPEERAEPDRAPEAGEKEERDERESGGEE